MKGFQTAASCHWWLIPLGTYRCEQEPLRTVGETTTRLRGEVQSCDYIDLNGIRSQWMCAAAGFIPFCASSCATLLTPFAHKNDNPPLHPTTPSHTNTPITHKSWLCLDVYDESVIISAGTFQLRYLTFLLLPEMGMN